MGPLLPLLSTEPQPPLYPPTASVMHYLHMVTDDQPQMLCQFMYLGLKEHSVTTMSNQFLWHLFFKNSSYYSLLSLITELAIFIIQIQQPFTTTYLSSVFFYYSRFCYSSFLNMLLWNKTTILLK